MRLVQDLVTPDPPAWQGATGFLLILTVRQNHGRADMSWSINSVSYRMAGSGSWQYLLADASQEKLYADIYPAGIEISKLDKAQKDIIAYWQEADILKIDEGQAVPMGPIMTDDDLAVLKDWFHDISKNMCGAVKTHLGDYHNLASKMAGNSKGPEFQNILTIMICAHTLDSMVFSRLRKTLMGTYVNRGAVGTFYFWGYGFSDGPKRIFGFTSYGGYGNAAVHVIRSHALDREKLKQVMQNKDVAMLLSDKYVIPMLSGAASADTAQFSDKDKTLLKRLQEVRLVDGDAPNQLAIPVFQGDDMRKASELYRKTSNIITKHFMEKTDELGGLVKKCSFAQCPSADVLCMLFHLAYSYAADDLVADGVVAEFPESAGAEWGVWIH